MMKRFAAALGLALACFIGAAQAQTALTLGYQVALSVAVTPLGAALPCTAPAWAHTGTTDVLTPASGGMSAVLAAPATAAASSDTVTVTCGTLSATAAFAIGSSSPPPTPTASAISIIVGTPVQIAASGPITPSPKAAYSVVAAGSTSTTAGLAAIVNAAYAAGTTNVTVPPGTYNATGLPANAALTCSVINAAVPACIIDGAVDVIASKACIDVLGPNVTLNGFDIKSCNGTAAEGANAGCIRDDGAGDNFTLINFICENSQSGIGPTVAGTITAGTIVTLDNGIVRNNGGCVSPDNNHDLYVNETPLLAITNVVFQDVTGTGCNLIKSRAFHTVLNNVTVYMNGEGHVDFPSGGDVTWNGGAVIMPVPIGTTSAGACTPTACVAGDMDTQLFDYCAEDAGAIAGGQTVKLTNVTFDSSNTPNTQVEVYLGNGGVKNCPAAVLDLSGGGDGWKGNLPVMTGWSSIVGGPLAAAAASAP